MKTAVIHSYNGMGDLIWHIPYIHAVAQQTKEKKVILFSKKSTNYFWNFGWKILKKVEAMVEIIIPEKVEAIVKIPLTNGDYSCNS